MFISSAITVKKVAETKNMVKSQKQKSDIFESLMQGLDDMKAYMNGDYSNVVVHDAETIKRNYSHNPIRRTL